MNNTTLTETKRSLAPHSILVGRVKNAARFGNMWKAVANHPCSLAELNMAVDDGLVETDRDSELGFLMFRATPFGLSELNRLNIKVD